MKVNVFLLIGLFVLFSCKEDITKRNQELIIGEWAPIDNDIYTTASFAGYIFEKEYCENKAGYYEYFHKNGSLLEFPYKEIGMEAEFCYTYNIDNDLYNVKSPCGYRTLYKIEKDTLQIFDLAEKMWVKYHVQFSSKDIMVLSNRYNNEIPDRFVRKVYKTDDQPLIDEFVFYYPPNCVSHSKCYLMRRDGFFFSYGYFGAKRFLIGRLQDDEFNRLDTLFKKADLSSILSHWDTLSATGWERPARVEENVSFVMNNRITTIDRMPLRSFMGRSVEAYWAYLAGLFLPDLAYITPIHGSDYPILLYEFDHFFNIRVKIQEQIFEPPATEQFYLGALLCYAEKVEDRMFEPKYTLTGFKDEKKTMQTDGRYFRYTNGYGREITLDIGFNFIEVNRFDQWLVVNGK